MPGIEKRDGAAPSRPRMTRGAKIVAAIAIAFVFLIMPRLNDVRINRQISSPNRVEASLALFSPANGDFVVLMPPSPTHSTQVHRLGAGASAALDVWSGLTGHSTYDVFIRDFPAQPDEFVIGPVGVAVQNTPGSKTLDDRVFRTNGMLCREFVQSDADFDRTYTRMILSGRRIYLLVLRTKGSATGAGDASRFFESFKVRHVVE